MKVIKIILTVVFVWSILKGIEIFTQGNSVDLLILQGAGLGWLFWLIVPLILILQTIGLWYIWRPCDTRYHAARAGVLLHLAETLSVGILGVFNPDLMIEAVIMASRIDHDLPVGSGVLDIIDSPIILIFTLILPIITSCLWLYLLAKINRKVKSKDATRDLKIYRSMEQTTDLPSENIHTV